MNFTPRGTNVGPIAAALRDAAGEPGVTGSVNKPKTPVQLRDLPFG